MQKYILVSIKEAIEGDFPVEDWMRRSFQEWGEWCWCVYETDGKKPIRFVGSDSSEPEDATLTRSFSWVVEELNKAASRE